ncbi:transcriptional regulator ATRX homolog, partial [Diaphorina citri]|uniref:Transcriptional regulator ATRX homolog n=1 Tax=Diaphorina citri TaxID=121845 RepID=A0A1S3DL16_DIACI
MAMRFQWADWKVEGQLRLVLRLKKDYYRNEMELRGEPVVSEEEKEEEAEAQFWWTNLVSDEDIEDITNSNKLLAFMFVLKQCEEIGDKLLVFSQSLETLSLLEYFLNRIDEASQDGTLDQNLSQFQASWTL